MFFCGCFSSYWPPPCSKVVSLDVLSEGSEAGGSLLLGVGLLLFGKVVIASFIKII
jgi:hypothetical protein